MREVKFLLARGFRFEQIATACGLNVMTVYAAYLGKYVPEIRAAYRHFTQTGKLPSP